MAARIVTVLAKMIIVALAADIQRSVYSVQVATVTNNIVMTERFGLGDAIVSAGAIKSSESTTMATMVPNNTAFRFLLGLASVFTCTFLIVTVAMATMFAFQHLEEFGNIVAGGLDKGTSQAY
jgi:hypothetical protein